MTDDPFLILVDAEADQITATLRDLTPEQRLGLIHTCLKRIANRGLVLMETDHPGLGASILAMSGLAAQAATDLIPTVGGIQSADHVLATFTAASRRVRNADR